MKSLIIIALILVAMLEFTSIVRSQTLITFEDLDPATLQVGNVNYEAPIPNGYSGFQWDNFWVLDVAHSGMINDPYNNALVSSNNLSFNAYGHPASMSMNGELFDLNSAYLTAGIVDETTVEVRGFVGNTLTYDNIYTVNTEAPTLVNFNYFGVDEVSFISGNATYPNYPVQFAMDNMVVTVPEPNTIGLLIFGIFACGLARIGKKRGPNLGVLSACDACRWKCRA